MGEQYRFLKESFKKEDYERFILVLDMGATHTYPAIMGVKNSKNYDVILKNSLMTKTIGSVTFVVNDTLRQAKEEYDINVSMACIGAAGPITRNRTKIHMTNIDIEVSEEKLLRETYLNRVILLNDFEAIGYGLDFLDLEKDTIELPHVGEDKTKGWKGTSTKAVIGAGTGLGMSICHYDFNKHLRMPLSSEGGHIDFTPYTDEERGLVDYVKREVMSKKDTYPELERILSGSGLELIFNYLSQNSEEILVKKIMSLSGVEKLSAIDKNYGKCDFCTRTLDMFFSIYARACRYLALISECYAGIFITGKVALANIDRLKDKKFMEMFEKHDKRSDVLRKVPVYVITNQNTALYGCCNVAVNFYNI